MKIVLITLNLILAALLVWGSVGIIRNLRSSKPEAGFTVKKKVPGTAKTKKESPPAATPATVTETEPVLPLATQVENIVKTNIFNQERCPNSGIFGSTRVEMTLVGTFTIGKSSGAIILQKAQTREMPFMPWMNQGQQGQQRQQGIGQRGGMSGNMGPNQNQNQGMGSSRRQMGGSRNTSQFNRGGMSNLQGTNTQGTNTQGTTAAAQQNTYKQYVRLGETLSNGYKLVEVTRTRVVLTRGGDKLELELADASKNQPQSSSTRSANPSQTQVMQQMMNSMQQMQQMQVMQGFQMMRMGQQQNQQGGDQPPQQNSGRNGTAARSRR